MIRWAKTPGSFWQAFSKSLVAVSILHWQLGTMSAGQLIQSCSAAQLVPFEICRQGCVNWKIGKLYCTYKKQSGTQREKKHVLTLTLTLVHRKSACKTSAGSSKILRWLTPLWRLNLDPKREPKQRPKRRNEKCDPILDPILGSMFGPKKWVQPSENFAAARTCCAADLRPSSLNMNVNSYLFLFASQVRSLLSRSLYRSHVLTTFLGSVLGALMKQVCWLISEVQKPLTHANHKN